MFCKKCGAELAEGASFCSKCGEKTGAGSASKRKPGKSFLKPALIICGAGLFLFVLIAALAGPGPKIKNITTSSGISEEGTPVSPAKVFAADTPRIYLIMDVFNAPEGAVIKSSWYQENLDSSSPFSEYSFGLPAGYANPIFSFAPDEKGWNEGSYRVDISINEKILGKAVFKIEGADPAQQTSPAAALRNTFSRRGFDFSIDYPKHWREVINNHIVILSGPAGSGEEFVTVTVQTLLSAQTGGKYRSLKDVYSDVTSGVNNLGGRIIRDKEPSSFIHDGRTFPAIRFVVEYTLHGTSFGEAVAVIQDGEKYFYQISYTAPEELFNKYIDTGIEIINSFRPEAGPPPSVTASSKLTAVDSEVLENLKDTFSHMAEIQITVNRLDEHTVWFDVSGPDNITQDDRKSLAPVAEQLALAIVPDYPAPQSIRVSFSDKRGLNLYADYSHKTKKTVIGYE